MPDAVPAGAGDGGTLGRNHADDKRSVLNLYGNLIHKGFPQSIERVRKAFIRAVFSIHLPLQFFAHLKDIKFNNGCLSGFIVCRICWIFEVFLLLRFIWFYIKWCQSGVRICPVPQGVPGFTSQRKAAEKSDFQK